MMKKFSLCAAAALALFTLGSCNKTTTEAGTEPEATLAENNAGVDTAEDAAVEVAAEGNVTALTDDNVYRPDMKVDQLTVLDFNATWCGPCKQFAPVFHAAAEKFGKTVKFVSVDTDNNPETAQAFGIQAIPTVVFLSPNGKTKTFVGTEDIMPDTRFFALVQGEM